MTASVTVNEIPEAMDKPRNIAYMVMDCLESNYNYV